MIGPLGPRVCITSMWRNDANRDLEARASHLYSKCYYAMGPVTFVWCVGDSVDDTYDRLLAIARLLGPNITITRYDTGITGNSIPQRRDRMSRTATWMFTCLPDDCDLVLMHESDLRTQTNIVGQLHLAYRFACLLNGAGPGNIHPYAVAGWPTIHIPGEPSPRFYDVWAYEHVNGQPFTPDEPRPQLVANSPAALIPVNSFGSVWMAPIGLVRNSVLGVDCIKHLCRQWRCDGARLYCAPHIDVIQPTHLWSDTWAETMAAE